MMLDILELMIGDWVKILNNKGEWIDNCKVDLNLLFAAENCVAILEPIPLTPEILEKNGWEERPTGYVFYTDGKRYDNSLWYIFGSSTFVVNTAEFQIKYVHELQHALKLCGVEKEIVL